MASFTHITTMWTTRHAAQVSVAGRGDGAAVERLERVLDRLLSARVRHRSVDLARLEGPDRAVVVELLAAVCHRLWARRGCLHVLGLRDRLVPSPEVTAFPEVFGEVPYLRNHTSPTDQPDPAHQLSPRNAG